MNVVAEVEIAPSAMVLSFLSVTDRFQPSVSIERPKVVFGVVSSGLCATPCARRATEWSFMDFSFVRWPVLGGLLAGVIACSSTPAQPTSQTPGTPGAASVTAPAPISPANNAQFKFADQPILVVVANSTVTQGTGATYLFEIATDAGFTAKVLTKDGVAAGTGGQTGVRLDTLAVSTNATTYYWHARAAGGGTTGVFGPTYKFVIGPAININAPIPVGPTAGASVSPRPTLTVINSVRSGPVGPITYRFEIADNTVFNPVTVSGNAAEGSGQTGFTPSSDLAMNKTYFWRVTAIDQTNAVSSPASAVQNFSTANPLWPGVQPPSGSGHALLGNNWQTQGVVSFTGVPFTSPLLDQQQLFDLLYRGLDPQGAIDWMNSNGYPTSAAYFPAVNVIGFPFSYLALINGRWDLIIRNGS
jgi:hypothetical protein